MSRQEFWDKMKSNYYSQNNEWVETDEETYHEMLCVLPPEAMAQGAFLVGEPWNHNGDGEAVFACFKYRDKKYSAQYMTMKQFYVMFK